MRDYKLEDEMRLQRIKNIDMNIINSGMKENKQLYNKFMDRINEIEHYIGANMNYNRDIQDERYRYNKLRTKLIDQRKRKEAREATEGI